MALDLKNYVPALKMWASITVDGSETISTNMTCNWNTVLWDAVTDTTTITWVWTITWKIVAGWTETIAAWGTTTAASLTVTVHDVDADAWGDIVTLADWVAGQIMVFIMKSATWTLTLTPATFLWGTSVTFDAAWDSVMMIFQTTLGWSVIGWNSYTVI